jgi:hypothetical protein
MTDVPIDQAPWHVAAEQRGISLEWLAAMTERSFATVYAYKTGRRRVPAAWLAKVELLLSGRDVLSGPADKAS